MKKEFMQAAFCKSVSLFRRSEISDPYGDDSRDVFLLTQVALDAQRQAIAFDASGQLKNGSMLLIYAFTISSQDPDDGNPLQVGDMVACGDYLSLDEARQAGARVWSVVSLLDCPRVGMVPAHLEASLA